MLPLIRYHWSYYTKSYRYLAPLIAYVGLLLFIYTISPNPVLESYAFSSVWLFVVSAWIAWGLSDLEPETQQAVTALHAGSAGAYYASKLLLMAAIGLLLTAFAVLYPALTGKLERWPTRVEWLAAASVHTAQSLLGTGIALWFTERGFGRSAASLPALIGVIVLSLASASAVAQLPEGMAFVRWLLPPAGILSEVLTGLEQGSAWTAAGASLYAFAYAGLLCGGFVVRAAGKKF
ncbi:hypothetical protein [Cohnella hashimotonis]|uniref:ABC transporter permease n=1 Tax=Cohnella hashimotonis TaxID=2826895 RepID=A0ABT6T961_9BACL|nr:hypothetical protein [Cohnella hashimotonis]MDI4643372.1 hypothetical protein [Cohnella hashimotonis]